MERYKEGGGWVGGGAGRCSISLRCPLLQTVDDKAVYIVAVVIYFRYAYTDMERRGEEWCGGLRRKSAARRLGCVINEAQLPTRT